MTKPLDGPRYGPASGGKPRHLVVFLHGWGSDGNDLISLAPPLAGALPHAAFVSPHAPEPCDMAPTGRQWFSLREVMERGEGVRAERIDAARPALTAFLETELASLGLGWGDLALVGFSQGTMMALHVGPRLATAPAAIVGFSGLLVAPERLPAECKSKPPILLVHGEADPMVAYSQLGLAVEGLRAAGIEPETLSRPGLGHGIDEDGFRAAAFFLRRHLESQK
jgi:phospholipase/carboxylesterase